VQPHVCVFTLFVEPLSAEGVPHHILSANASRAGSTLAESCAPREGRRTNRQNNECVNRKTASNLEALQHVISCISGRDLLS
jgi:hypothetical protein